MRKLILIVKFLLFMITLVGTNQIAAQSCCPEFELQFPKFNCETPDCGGGTTGGQPSRPPATMCQYSTNKIQVVPGGIPGFTYVWNVTGGTINGNILTTLTTGLSYIDVTWGNGSLGTIKVTIFNSDSSCFKLLTQEFCLTKSPKALYVKNTGDTVCKNQPITFTNTSLGAYTSWYWNFGDGNTQNGGMSVTHAYALPGIYTVSLTVNNSKGQSSCGCSNTFTRTITVNNSTGLQILTPDCKKMHCAGDTVTYCASITGCSTYNWSALGGTVIGSGSCIKVVWNALSASITNPTVTLTIPPSCAGSCSNTTSFVEKILYSGMPIQGNNLVCLNAATTFTLPSLPGVFYTWSITPATGFTIINGTNINTPAFGVNFTAAGSYTIICNYIDSLQNCMGTSSKIVQVRPPYSILGPNTSCVTCNSAFGTNPPGNFNWNINTTPATTATGPGISNTWTSLQTGTFTVTATQIGSAFCNSPQQAIIVVAPKPVLTIFKSQNVACPGTVVKFWVSSTVTDMPVSWVYPPGTQVLNNPGTLKDTIYLSFSGAGPYTVTATQFCKYNCTSTSISTSVSNPPAPVLNAPKTTVCIDEVVTYTVTSALPGIIYNWSISNPNLGTIQSGQGTPTVNILWHGNTTNSGILKVSHCGGFAQANINVTLPLAVSISKTGSCFSNGLGYTLTANPAGQTYLWSTGATTQSINILTPGVYTVTVNPGGGGSCPVTKSIPVTGDGYEFVILPPCIVSNCNLNSFSIPLSQLKLNLPCAATLQWYFKPVGNILFSPISGATSPTYNATQLGCYQCVATCANGCNVTSNTICIPDDIYFCCSSPSCNSITYGIDFTSSGCNPTVFNGFYTGSGTPTGGFPINYCYGDGTSTLLPPLTQSHQYAAAGRYTVCISQKTLVFNPSSGTNDTCCISNCKSVDVPVVAGINASYNCATGILSMGDASSYYPNSTGATFSWTVTGGSYTGTLGNTTNESVIPTTSGSYTITLNVTNGTCTATATALVNVVIPNANFTVNPNPTCSKDIAFFNTTPGFASYYWQFGDGSYSYAAPAATPQHQYTNNGNTPINFSAILTVTTIDGCVATSTKIVSVHPKPIVAVTPNPSTICRGGSVLLTANINPNGNTMCSSYAYQWKRGGVNISGATSATYSATDYGLYSVFVSGATPGCNCTMLSDTAVVKFFPDPVANIENTSTVCFDPASNPWSFNLLATSYAGYTYNWSCSNAGVSFSPNSSTSNFTTATGTLVNNANFIIYLQVVDANGCVAFDSLCISTFNNPSVTINSIGSLCANSLNTLGVVSPNINFNYIWNSGASGPVFNTTLAGTYFATATNLLTGCSAPSNAITINPAPSLELFPIGCDTICSDASITIPLAQLPNLSNYFVQWFDGIKPAGTLIYSGNGAITIPGNFLSLGLHHLWTTVSFPNGCQDSSGVFDVFVKNCCNCAGSNWAFRQYSTDSGVTYQNWNCALPEIAIGCNPLTLNAAYNCSPSGCAGTVTAQLLDNLGNVILNIPFLPYTYTPAPGTSGNFFIKLIGWCDGVKCDSCTRQVFYNCPLPEPPCGCDTAFHFTGQPIIILPQIDDGFNVGGTPQPLTCGTTYPGNLECQKNYQFYYNYQNPWPSGNCPTMVVGEILLGGNVIYTQTNVSQASPLNYVFTSGGVYCVKLKLMVNGIACDSCTICFNVSCNVNCNCVEGFQFTGSPVIIANLPNANIKFPPPIVCNTSLARPLMCNTSYSFYINYTNPYSQPCVAKDSAVIVMVGNPIPLVINPNTNIGNPITYTFTQSGTYCVKHYLVVNGVICKECIVCFSVECPNPCNCNAFAFTSNPTITFSMGSVKGVPVVSSLSSGCETSLATQLQCRRRYNFFISAGAIGAQLPAGCVAIVKATLTLNNVPVITATNVSAANPLIYTFNREGIYCIKYELYVNGVLCKTCTQCFFVKCCPIYYTLPALRGNFTGCVIGGTTQIYNDSTGGTFRSLDTTVARVDNNGVVTAVNYGKAIIVYEWIKDPCNYYAVAEYNVPLLTALAPISGNAAICKTTDSVKLDHPVSGGVWSSSNPAIASVSSGTNITRTTFVKGISSGVASIRYTVPQSGCPVSISKDVIVHNIVMEPTTGPANVCRGAVIALQNSTVVPGNFSKQWLSSNTKATVNSNGNVTGISAGAVRITYKLNYSNQGFGTCSSAAIRDLTVLAIPATPAISFIVRPTYAAGTTNVCLFSTFVLRGSIAGGTWSSAGAVTVNSNGLVTASSVGTGTVTYTVYNSTGCSNSRTVIYNVVSCESYVKSANTAAINKDATPVLLMNPYKFILYPNPARTRVFFNVALEAGEGNAVLSDMQGKELKIIVFKPGINSIEISNYPSGMYFITFRTKQGFQTEKLVIE
ncbi:MAG: PKD domain-containing protein [Sphingobacteriales bacterium]|nr:PKD domain-containing protein [Sphingobacteriales bacterium]